MGQPVVKANVLIMYPNNQTASMIARSIVSNVHFYMPSDLHEQVMPTIIEEIQLESARLDVREGLKMFDLMCCKLSDWAETWFIMMKSFISSILQTENKQIIMTILNIHVVLINSN